MKNIKKITLLLLFTAPVTVESQMYKAPKVQWTPKPKPAQPAPTPTILPQPTQPKQPAPVPAVLPPQPKQPAPQPAIPWGKQPAPPEQEDLKEALRYMDAGSYNLALDKVPDMLNDRDKEYFFTKLIDPMNPNDHWSKLNHNQKETVKLFAQGMPGIEADIQKKEFQAIAAPKRPAAQAVGPAPLVSIQEFPLLIPTLQHMNSPFEQAPITFNNFTMGQITTLNQFEANAGGAASCGYQAVKNAREIIKAIMDQHNKEALDLDIINLTDKEYAQILFAKPNPAKNIPMGNWRKNIIKRVKNRAQELVDSGEAETLADATAQLEHVRVDGEWLEQFQVQLLLEETIVENKTFKAEYPNPINTRIYPRASQIEQDVNWLTQLSQLPQFIAIFILGNFAEGEYGGGHWFAIVAHKHNNKTEYILADSAAIRRYADPHVFALIMALERNDATGIVEYLDFNQREEEKGEREKNQLENSLKKDLKKYTKQADGALTQAEAAKIPSGKREEITIDYEKYSALGGKDRALQTFVRHMHGY